MAVPSQRVVILAGLPASGKTTLAHSLQAYGFVWINQDVMGTRKDCEKAFTEALYAGRDIVVDRCNFNQQQREIWLHYARNYGAQCIGVQIMIPIEVCIERALARTHHPTLGTKESIHEVIPRFAADFRVMQPYEGFTQMFTVEQQADIVRFMRYIDPAFRKMPQPVQPAYGQASMQQRIPDHPPVPDMPQHMPGHLPFRPQQWRPSHSQWNNRSMPQHAWGGSNSMPHDSGGPPIHQTSTGWLPASSNGRQHMHFAPGPPNVHDQHPASQEGPSKKKETQKGSCDKSNIVSFPTHPDGTWLAARPVSDTPQAAQRFLDHEAKESPEDTRPILLFDLNGTLTSHTAERRSAGVNLMRPGIHHLVQLQEMFRLGVFSSASQRTISSVIPMLEQAAAPGKTKPKDKLLPFKQLIMTRAHTVAAPKHHVVSGGKAWDTVKPLHRWFSDVSRVIIVDDDAYKAVEGEESNMIVIPRWEQERDDTVLGVLTAALVSEVRKLGDIDTADIRLCTQAVTQKVQQHAGKRVASDSEVSDGRAAIVLTSDSEAANDEVCESMDVEQARKMLEQHSDFRQVEAGMTAVLNT